MYGGINSHFTWLASAARTATETQAEQTNFSFQGITAYLNISAAPGVETLILSLQEKDPVSGTWTTIAASSARSATGLITVKLMPEIAAVAASTSGHVVQAMLPYIWRLVVTHSASGSFTYSANYVLHF